MLFSRKSCALFLYLEGLWFVMGFVSSSKSRESGAYCGVMAWAADLDYACVKNRREVKLVEFSEREGVD